MRSWDSASAMARPIPRLAPVTMATLFAKSSSIPGRMPLLRQQSQRVPTGANSGTHFPL